MQSMNLKRLLLMCLLLLSTQGMIVQSINAEILLYPFNDPAKEARFNVLIQELRCPKCQNNNLADSNAGLAVDLKNIIYEKINAGESDEQIVTFLRDRYGDFISYRPPLKPSTWVIWFGPFILLLLGGYFIIRFINNREASTNKENHAVLSNHSADLLNQWKQDSKNRDDA